MIVTYENKGNPRQTADMTEENADLYAKKLEEMGMENIQKQ